MSVVLQLDDNVIRPLIDEAVEAAIARMEDRNAKLNGRLSFTINEAARLLGVGVGTLRDLRARGEIQGHLVGRKLLFRRDELVRLLERTGD